MSTAETVKQVRRHLHRHPELSGEEALSSKYLQDFISKHFSGYNLVASSRDHGFIATKRFGDGPHIAFRAELDALPVHEENSFDYKSVREEVSHACGHDGHMATLIATMFKLKEQGTDYGTASFLFQPSEETGAGAAAMMEDEAFIDFHPDALLALHNIPGMPLGMVLSREGTFSCGSVGVRLKIVGKTAHAAHPEDAVNPLILTKLFLDELLSLIEKADGFALATPIALRSGQKSFGTSPLKSTLLVTLRAARSHDLERLMTKVEERVDEINEIEGAKAVLRFEEFFPVTSNKYFEGDVRAVCKKLKRPFRELSTPFRWSEDFSQYGERLKTHIFGIGSGKDVAPLHASTYDFPDELADSGAQVFVELYKHLMSASNES